MGREFLFGFKNNNKTMQKTDDVCTPKWTSLGKRKLCFNVSGFHSAPAAGRCVYITGEIFQTVELS